MSRGNMSFSRRALRWRVKNRHSMPGVSCDRCGTPYPMAELVAQDDLLVGPCCLFAHGVKELDAIEAADPETMYAGEAVFDGRL